MNKLELARRRNDNARILEHSSKIHRNCIRINTKVFKPTQLI